MFKPGRNTLCPCGSGKKFKICCLGKTFNIVDDDEDSYTIQIPIKGQLEVLLQEFEATFKKHFERIPGEGDPVLLTRYLLSEEDVERGITEAMEKAGSDPAHIYAYKKTGYLIVEDNLERFTGAAIAEWNAAVAEYDAIGSEPSDGPEAEVFDETLRSLVREFESFIYAFGLAHDNFFNTELLHESSEKCASVLNPSQYQALCVSRVHRTLRSVRLLEENRMSEDMFKLARTIYESYLHIILIQTRPESMEIVVDAVVGLRKGTHQYKKHRDGSDNKRYIIEVSTGREFLSQISAYKMAKGSPIVEDLPFFDFFYRTTSEFLHPTVFALDAYLSAKGLDPLKRHMHEEAIIFTACVTAMVADTISNIQGCPERVRRDCNTVVTRTRRKLLVLLEQLDVWQKRMGATKDEISILRARCLRLGNP